MIKETSMGVLFSILRHHGTVDHDSRGERITPADIEAFKAQEPPRSCLALGKEGFISEHGCRQYQAGATRRSGHEGKDKLNGSPWRRKLKLSHCAKCDHATEETIRFVEGTA